MRFAELIITEEEISLSQNVKEVLNYLIHQANDSTSAGAGKKSWQAIIQMVNAKATHNTPLLDEELFIQMYDNGADWTHLIRNFDEDGVALSTDEEAEEIGFEENPDAVDPEKVVGQMADRALNART
jgi:hypothetical protein